MKKEELEGRFILPGEEITTKSSFKSGEGTFLKNDSIYAEVTGEIQLKGKKIEVHPVVTKESLPPQKGEIVIGRVESVRNVSARIKLLYFIRDGELHPIERGVAGSIYIGDLGTRAREFSDALQRGDIILGKLSIARGIPFSISFEKRKEYGCVAAKCEKCGTPMIKKGRAVFCEECKEYRKRKISSLYDFDTFSSLLSFFRREKG